MKVHPQLDPSPNVLLHPSVQGTEGVEEEREEVWKERERDRVEGDTQRAGERNKQVVGEERERGGLDEDFVGATKDEEWHHVAPRLGHLKRSSWYQEAMIFKDSDYPWYDKAKYDLAINFCLTLVCSLFAYLLITLLIEHDLYNVFKGSEADLMHRLGVAAVFRVVLIILRISMLRAFVSAAVLRKHERKSVINSVSNLRSSLSNLRTSMSINGISDSFPNEEDTIPQGIYRPSTTFYVLWGVFASAGFVGKMAVTKGFFIKSLKENNSNAYGIFSALAKLADMIGLLVLLLWYGRRERQSPYHFGKIRHFLCFLLIVVPYSISILSADFDVGPTWLTIPLTLFLVFLLLLWDKVKDDEAIRISPAYCVMVVMLALGGPFGLGVTILDMFSRNDSVLVGVALLIGFQCIMALMLEVTQEVWKRATRSQSNQRLIILLFVFVCDDMFVDLIFSKVEPFGAVYWTMQLVCAMRIFLRNGMVIKSMICSFKRWYSPTYRAKELEKSFRVGTTLHKLTFTSEKVSHFFIFNMIMIEKVTSVASDTWPKPVLSAEATGWGTKPNAHWVLLGAYLVTFTLMHLWHTLAGLWVLPRVRKWMGLPEKPPQLSDLYVAIQSAHPVNLKVGRLIIAYLVLYIAWFVLPIYLD